MNQFFYNIADKHACFFDWMQIPTQRAAQKKKTNAYIGWLQTRHNRSSNLSEHSISKKCEWNFAYLFVNDQWKLNRNKGKWLNDTNEIRSCELNTIKNCFKDRLGMWLLFLYSKYNGIVLPLHES